MINSKNIRNSLIKDHIDYDIDESEFLFQAGKLFTSSLHLTDLLNGILSLMARYFDIKRGLINIYHEELEKIIIDASYGYTSQEIKRGSYKPGEGIIGTVIKTGKPFVAPSINNEPLFLNKTGSQNNSNESIAFISVPIKIDDTVIGTISINILNKERTSFTRELNITSMIAVMIAHAVNDRRQLLQMESKLKEENRKLKIKLTKKLDQGKLIGNSDLMKNLYENIMLIAPTASTVLITGETGTGKELIADAIHKNSKRKEKPFIKVNIASLPENLIESELFGHEKGAFTGAITMKKGRFELANGGTIFLDEIGDLNMYLQVKLLRIIQEKCIERIGGTDTISFDVRIISATHQNLESKIRKGEFREDLFYRLNVFPILSPPLRDRKADILLLSDYFINKYNKEFNKTIKRISTGSIDMLTSYHWPGNVRELENTIQRGVILSHENVLRSYHLPPSLQMAEENVESKNSLDEMTNQYVKEIIIDHLKITGGNITKAAELLNTTKRILNYKIATLNINFQRYKES